MKELFSCYSQRTGFWDVRVRNVYFGAEKSTTAIPWYHWRVAVDDTWERENSAVEKSRKQADGSMRVGQPAYIKSLDFCGSRETEKRAIGRCTRG